MSRNFIPGAEPLFLAGTDTGCLLLHGGGGGTTWDLKEFANRLHSETGWTVWLPALSGFGTRPEDLESVTFDDLLADANAGVDKLLDTCQVVYVMGHSAGGLLSLVLASEREEVSGIVTWAAPVTLKVRNFSLLSTVSRIPLLRRALPKRYAAPVPQWLKDQGWIGYEELPISIGFIMLHGIQRLKECLGQVTCPVLIMQGSEDTVVKRESMMIIHDRLASERKEMYIIEGADHPMMNQEAYKEDLFSHTIGFLQSVCQDRHGT